MLRTDGEGETGVSGDYYKEWVGRDRAVRVHFNQSGEILSVAYGGLLPTPSILDRIRDFFQ